MLYVKDENIAHFFTKILIMVENFEIKTDMHQKYGRNIPNDRKQCCHENFSTIVISWQVYCPRKTFI